MGGLVEGLSGLMNVPYQSYRGQQKVDIAGGEMRLGAGRSGISANRLRLGEAENFNNSMAFVWIVLSPIIRRLILSQ